MDITIRQLGNERIAPDTYVIRQLMESSAPVAVHLNTMVITGTHPVIVDTGAAMNRHAWMDAVFSIVEPEDVQFVYLSHDDVDHTGNVNELLEKCTQATLVTNWFSAERMATDNPLPVDRMRWVNGGESFFAGDRELVAVVPPVFDSPTTRGLFDRTTGVYWAADAMGSPVTHQVDDIRELDPGFWREAFVGQQLMISPWMQFVDPVRYDAHLRRLADLGATAVANCHGVTLRGPQIASAIELLKELPHRQPVAWPGQAELDAMHDAMRAHG